MTYDYAHHLINTRLSGALINDVFYASRAFGRQSSGHENYLAARAFSARVRHAFAAGIHIVDVAEAAGLPTHQFRDDRPTFNVWHGPLRQAIEPGVPGRVA